MGNAKGGCERFRGNVLRALGPVLALALGAWPGGQVAHGREVTVAAAAVLQFALNEVVVEFNRAHPDIRVRATYGSSGNFHAQLLNRAPFDLFLSADTGYPRRLAAAGHALADEVFVYGTGRIVLWAPADSPVAVERLGIGALLDPRVRTIAVANPRHAPYGAAAIAALHTFGVHEAVEARLVFGENAAQAAHFVQSGAADLGILALALVAGARIRGGGRLWEIPADAHPALEQGGIVLARAVDVEAACLLRDFLLGSEGRAVLGRHGIGEAER